MKRASYREAIEWILYNDKPEDENSTGHITSCLIADIFNVPVTKVLADIFKKDRNQHERLRNSTSC